MGPKEITINMNKVLDLLLPKRDKALQEKLIHYIRIYTDLIRAEENLNPLGFGRTLNYLRVVRNMTKKQDFKDEEVYLKRIYEIANEILENKRRLSIRIKKCSLGDKYCDPYDARTKLQLAQNICILRLLRRENS